MHRRFFVRPAGLLGFVGIVGFAALRKLSCPAMVVGGGEGDGAADNSRGFTMYRMKTSLGSFEWLHRDAIHNRSSWRKGEAKSPSMAAEEKAKSPSMTAEEKAKRLIDEYEASQHHRREAIRHLQWLIDEYKAFLSRQESLLYEMKSKGIGNPQIWCLYENVLSKRTEKFQTLVVNFDELKGIQESLVAVTIEQMKTSPGSSHYHDLNEMRKELTQQHRVCYDNHVRAIDEHNRVRLETKE